MNKGAQSLIVYHNHPGGCVDPSAHDHELAHRLVEAGKLLNLPLLDFIIVAKQGYYSLREQHVQGAELAWAAETENQLTLAEISEVELHGPATLDT